MAFRKCAGVTWRFPVGQKEIRDITMEIIWQVGEDNLEDPRTTQHQADKSIAGAWAFGAFAEADKNSL